MPKPIIAAILAAWALTLAGAAAANGTKLGNLRIEDPWARASIGPAKTGVAYLEITNQGEAIDRLIAVETPVAGRAGLHTHIMEGGIARMRPVPEIEIAPGRSVTLAPGGLHIMLMGLDAPLKEGQRFPLTLTFADAGQVTVEAKVARPGAEQAPQGAGAETHTTERHGEHDHGSHERGSHEHEDVVNLAPGPANPTIDLEIAADPMAGWNVHIATTNFRFTPERASLEHREGEGHAHLYVDGEKLARVYGPWYHIAGLDAGLRLVTATLNSNDHRIYAVGREPLSDTVTLRVGAVPQDQRIFDLAIRKRQLVGQDTLRVTQGDKIRLQWTSDETSTVHLHGYDIELALEPGVAGIMSFEARITGRFPISSHGFGAEDQHGHRALLYLEVHPD